MRLGEGGREIPSTSDLYCGIRAEARLSSTDGNAIPLPKDFKPNAAANEDVRRIVLETPLDIEFMVSLRVILGRMFAGEGGGSNGEDCNEPTRVRTVPAFEPPDPVGGARSEVHSNRLKGESSSNTMI